MLMKLSSTALKVTYNLIQLLCNSSKKILKTTLDLLTGEASHNYADLSIPLYSCLAVRMLIHLNRLPVYGMYAAYWNRVFKGSRSNLNQWNDGAHSLANDEGILSP